MSIVMVRDDANIGLCLFKSGKMHQGLILLKSFILYIYKKIFPYGGKISLGNHFKDGLAGNSKQAKKTEIAGIVEGRMTSPPPANI